MTEARVFTIPQEQAMRLKPPIEQSILAALKLQGAPVHQAPSGLLSQADGYTMTRWVDNEDGSLNVKFTPTEYAETVYR